MGSRITTVCHALHHRTFGSRIFTSAAQNRRPALSVAGVLLAWHMCVQAQQPALAAKPSVNNAHTSSPKESLLEVFHLGGKPGEIVIAGRAMKPAPAEAMHVELAFQSEIGPVSITLPVKRTSPDTARLASFEFETAVHGLPQIAPSDPRHAEPFFAILIADHNGNRYYEEESYAQFVSAEETAIKVERVRELPARSLFVGARKVSELSLKKTTRQQQAFALSAVRQSANACLLEWSSLPAATSPVNTPNIVLRNEQHVAITFGNRYLDQHILPNPKKSLKYRVEKIGSDGLVYSSSTVEVSGEAAREASGMSAMDSGGLYAAGSYVERTPAALAAVVSSHNAAIQYCYQRELKRNSELKGEIRVRIVVSPRGSVDSVNVLSSTIKNPVVEDCVTGRIKRWNDFGASDPLKGKVAIKQTYVFGY